MKEQLAEQLLAKVMKWKPEDVARERPQLQAIASFKYDEYQQYSPGMRFVESLALWLNQFQTDADRNEAYEFMRSKLIFISNHEMMHLVSIAFPDFIRPLLFNRLANELKFPERLVVKLARSHEYNVFQRQSLFLGLSDGARTDLFRRANPFLTNEQVWQTYELSKSKADDLILELRKDLKEILKREPTLEESKFQNIFLLDDFSGSGLSYIRGKKDGSYGGKIAKTLTRFHSDEDFSKIVDPSKLNIFIVIYLATTQALKHLEETTKEWLIKHKSSSSCTVIPIQLLNSDLKVAKYRDKDLFALLEKYFDPSIVDEHFKVGKYEEPYLGYDECALPLILSHNTPNNSLPILWFDENLKYRGLFPRVSRHKSEI
jgi:hypothetical protein